MSASPGQALSHAWFRAYHVRVPRNLLFGPLFVLALASGLAPAASTDGMKSGRAPVQSPGPLAFGPDGVLFLGDSVGAKVFALDTGDRAPGAGSVKFEVKGIDAKIGALLGTAPDQVLIYDTAVNPISKNVYIAVSRGRGPDAQPVILKVDGAGRFSELSLENIRYSSVTLPNPASVGVRNQRLDIITYIQFVDGNVMVAGLSNEEFSSNLRSIPFPFASGDAASGAGIEIFHTSHASFETNAPVRTFVPVKIGGKPYILAAYTCTPLVKIPVSELIPGNRVSGETIAELGAGNRPLDMIAYRKDGHDYILIANSARGVVRLPADHLESFEPIVNHTGPSGVPRTRMPDWKRVHQLKKMDDATAVILTDADGSIDLRTVALP